MPSWVRRGPMLPTAGRPPDMPGWSAEVKWDGMRALAVASGDGVRLLSRSGREITSAFPELQALGEQLAGHGAVLDGEIVTPGADGRPDFARLQTRMHRTRPPLQLLVAHPALLYVFDLLHLDGTDLLATSYRQRRGMLDALALRAGAIQVPDSYTDIAPAELLEIARQHRLEGIVAKALDSPYRPGARTRSWIKTTLRQTTECTVGGWIAGRGRHRDVVGSLLLGVPAPYGRLHFAGHVGTGFTDHERTAFAEALSELAEPTSPFVEPVPREVARHAHWATPVLTVEIEYREWTDDGRLRAPSFQRLVDLR